MSRSILPLLLAAAASGAFSQPQRPRRPTALSLKDLFSGLDPEPPADDEAIADRFTPEEKDFLVAVGELGGKLFCQLCSSKDQTMTIPEIFKHMQCAPQSNVARACASVLKLAKESDYIVRSGADMSIIHATPKLVAMHAKMHSSDESQAESAFIPGIGNVTMIELPIRRR